MGWKNGRYVLDLEPLGRAFRSMFRPKPKPVQPARPVAPKKQNSFQAMGSYYGQIKDIEKELNK